MELVIGETIKQMSGTTWKENNGILELIKGQGEKGEKPIKVGVLFSGGPAPGGNNVVTGLYRALKAINQKNLLIGFLGGPKGLIDQKWKAIEEGDIEAIINTGGFHFLGTGRTKIETEEQFQKVFDVVKTLDLQGLVLIGGDDTNTNALFLSDYLEKKGSSVSVVGIPKTIDGDMRSKEVEASFGFDTATKVYNEVIGNICMDAASSLKYWHFIKVMGRNASHVTLECALSTHPNYAFISEEVAHEKWTLHFIIQMLADLIEKRAKEGKKYGVVLIPEGLIEAIAEMKELLLELNRLLAEGKGIERLSENTKKVFLSLPESVQKQLLLDRDPHGNVQVSKIDTEKLLSEMVGEELKKRSLGKEFQVQHHFFGYEGRCSHPSLFDATYCYSLGYVAAHLIQGKKTGYMAAIKGLVKDPSEWQGIAVSIRTMMTEEERKGVIKKVIQKAYVDLKGPVFACFKKQRERDALSDAYVSPGPMQFFGPTKNLTTKTLQIESGGRG